MKEIGKIPVNEVTIKLKAMARHSQTMANIADQPGLSRLYDKADKAYDLVIRDIKLFQNE